MPQAVVAHMIPEGPFGLEARHETPADAEIRLGQNGQRQFRGARQVHPASAKQTGEAQFRESLGQGHDRRHAERGRAAHIDMHRQFLAPGDGVGVVRADAPVDLIMQARLVGRIGVARQLHPVHAQIGGVQAGAAGIFAINQGQGDKGAAVARPAGQARQIGEIAVALQHRSAAVPLRARQHADQTGQRGQRAPGPPQGRRGIGLGRQHGVHGPQTVPENIAQALARAEEIGQHGKTRILDSGEEQSRGLGPECPALHGGQFQTGVQLHIHAPELPLGLQIRQAPIQIGVAHQQSPFRAKSSTAPSVRRPARTSRKSARMRAWSKASGSGRPSGG